MAAAAPSTPKKALNAIAGPLTPIGADTLAKFREFLTSYRRLTKHKEVFNVLDIVIIQFDKDILHVFGLQEYEFPRTIANDLTDE